MAKPKSAARALRLPPVTTALVLLTVGMEIEREQHGWKSCRDNFVGPRRMALGHCIVARAPPGNARHEAVEDARDGARALLSEFCGVCPHKLCAMKRW